MFTKKYRFFIIYLTTLIILLNPSLAQAANFLSFKAIQTQTPEYKSLVDQLIRLKSRSNTVGTIISKLDTRLIEIDSKINPLQSKISKTEFELSQQGGILNQRIKAIYENSSSSSPLEIILESSSFHDFINKVRFFEFLLKNDAQIIKKMKSNKKTLMENKNELVTSREKIIRLKNEKQSSIREIGALKTELNRRIKLANQNQLVEMNRWVELAAKIDRFLEGYSSPLAGYGQVFVAAGRQYQVDPRLIVAISGVESTFGKHNIRSRNAWGRKAVGGGWKSYGSWDEAIWDQAMYLRTRYLDLGLTEFKTIGKKYCPPDPSWPDKVKAFFMMI